MSSEFCDTNVLIYAYDLSAGRKRDQARQVLQRLWDSGAGVTSVQVLQELFVALTRKVVPPVSSSDARIIVADMAAWRVIAPTGPDVLTAIDATVRWQISFWDAMVVVAANKAGAIILWSDDLNDGQSYDDVTVRNPFAAHAGGP